jgi:hypothetical protein
MGRNSQSAEGKRLLDPNGPRLVFGILCKPFKRMAGTTRLELATSAVTVRCRGASPCVFKHLDDVQSTKKRPFGTRCPRDAPKSWRLPSFAGLRLSFADRAVFTRIRCSHGHGIPWQRTSLTPAGPLTAILCIFAGRSGAPTLQFSKSNHPDAL